MKLANTPRLRWIGAGILTLALVAAALGWWLRPREPQPRARQYIDFTACLFTGPNGLQSPTATPVWAGMQNASLATRTRVQYIAVTEPVTIDNAAAYLAGLAQGRCQVIIAVDDQPAAAVNRDAAKYPTVAFYILGERANAPAVAIPANPADQVTQRVADAVTKRVNERPQ